MRRVETTSGRSVLLSAILLGSVLGLTSVRQSGAEATVTTTIYVTVTTLSAGQTVTVVQEATTFTNTLQVTVSHATTAVSLTSTSAPLPASETTFVIALLVAALFLVIGLLLGRRLK